MSRKIVIRIAVLVVSLAALWLAAGAPGNVIESRFLGF